MKHEKMSPIKTLRDIGQFFYLKLMALQKVRYQMFLISSEKFKGHDANTFIEFIKMGSIDRRSFIKKLKEVKVEGVGSPVLSYVAPGRATQLLNHLTRSEHKEHILWTLKRLLPEKKSSL